MRQIPTDPRRSFDNAADIYEEIRPGYPPAMFVDLFRQVEPEPLILEVGPGTGQATRGLILHNATVHAVEIGPSMAAKLRKVVSPERLTVTVGDFEKIEIDAQSLDAVFSASAYHWISPQAQLDRPADILKPDRVLAVVDLIQVSSDDDDGFFAAAQPIYEKSGEAHADPPAPKRDAAVPAIRGPLLADERYSHVETRYYDWNQIYTAHEYRKLMVSYSGTQMMTPDNRQGLLDDIEAFIDHDFAGRITRPIVAILTTAACNA